jgi:hypothetical protein
MTMLEQLMPHPVHSFESHRVKRVVRRHADLPDFLTRAAFAKPRWLPSPDRRAQLAPLVTVHWRPRQAA